jgi:hypothetical protein
MSEPTDEPTRKRRTHPIEPDRTAWLIHDRPQLADVGVIAQVMRMGAMST